MKNILGTSHNIWIYTENKKLIYSYVSFPNKNKTLESFFYKRNGRFPLEKIEMHEEVNYYNRHHQIDKKEFKKLKKKFLKNVK
tara:strand:+ start:755 stop:1003 length:249 start_codon:yes stop_codon:yes gene_type:complete